MKKENERKVSLIRCLKIFETIKMPWHLLVLAFVFTIISGWVGLLTVTFAGDAVDASGAIPAKELVTYIVASVGALICSATATTSSRLAQIRIQYLLRNKLWNKVIVTKQSAYDLDGGESMVSRITADCEYVCKFFEVTFNIVTVIISAAMYLVQLYVISPKITGWVMVYIPISLLFGAIYTFLRFLMAIKAQKSLSDTTAYLAERTKDINLIKTCNAQDRELAMGKQYFQKQFEVEVKTGFVAVFSSVITLIMDIVMRVVPFAVGAVLVANGEITIGLLVTANTLFGNVNTVFKNLISYAGTYREANGALARVALFLEADEEERIDVGIALPENTSADIVLDSVHFGYTQEKKILNEFSCVIPHKKVTAILGKNGAGKSTVFKLLTRLYEPDSGVICFGEDDASVYTLRSWRKKICLIAQGSPMLEGTIRENMCYGREDAVTEEELIRVAKLSHVYDFVKDLPNGFDSELAPGGSNFSGGQRQCIAIARAMLSKAEYLLLDEMTSNMDATCEREVMEAMHELMKEKTTIIIAHSLSAIRNADHVIIINDGKVESSGAPSIVLKETGNYLQTLMDRQEVHAS